MSDNSSTSTKFYDETTKVVHDKKVTLLPKKGKAVGLGVFKTTAPNPDFEITYSPDNSEVGVSYERLEITGQSRYVLLCQFQNFTPKACEVTMHLKQSVPMEG